MTPATTHPLVTAWLHDLELMLHDLEPGDRAEVLAGVHEHLDASLGPGASDEDVRRVLAGLGSPQSVADEAYAGRPPAVVTARPPGSPWAALVATALNALGVALQVPFVLWGASDWYAILFGFTALLLPWAVTCVLTAVSGSWSPREKAWSILVLPATIIGLSVVTGVMVALIGRNIVNLVPDLAVLGAAAWVLVRLGRSALR